MPTRAAVALTLCALCTQATAQDEPVLAFHRPLMEQVVVTATREEKSRTELPESVAVLDREAIEQVMPGHPAELLNRLAGVHINNQGGEGHMTAIRQPLTTGGVYLFLEDGIPTRPTGFFNHNGLYEIDLTQADTIEVTRGPGSALYGSDAIGGIINSLTRAPGEERETALTLEAGQDDWYRVLLATSGAVNETGRAGVRVNLTDNRGFREAGDYSRASLTARWDQDWSATLTGKTVLAFSTIDQSGVSGLGVADYRNDPEKNLYHGDIGFREVRALRLSSELAWEPSDRELWTLTGFVRDNRMELMPFWMLSYDPNRYTTEFTTLGLMAKHRRTLGDGAVEWISGLDLDYTPSSYREERILPARVGDIYTDYRTSGRINYDFDADQLTASPYSQLEWLATERLRLTAGVRYDHFRIDYQDNLDPSVAEVGVFAPLPFPARHYRPQDQRVTFSQWSPKLGLVYDLSDDHNLYANYRHAFRAATAGQLFRSGAVPDTTALEPVTAVSRELGLRGQLAPWLGYDLALYQMTVEDDIVNLISDGTRKTLNAGETRHRGIELSLNARWAERWSAALAFSHSRQDYRDFSYICGAATCNFAGNDLPRAPRNLGNATLAYGAPDDPWGLELEWEYLGSYYTDELNSQEYGGHGLVNLRGHRRLTEGVEVYARLRNLTDRTHATYVSNQVGVADLEYRPGQPRTLTVGVRVGF